MPAPESIQQLVAKFEEHRESYRSGRYNEAQMRQEFLNPFFEALGWDMYQQAAIRRSLQGCDPRGLRWKWKGPPKPRIMPSASAGVRKFFVEAKKPAVNIEYDIHPAFQLRRYAWSAKLPLGILTDFEEFAVYDCRSKPDKSDSAATGRVMLLNYKDYIDKMG